jgi:hypothetical protein
MTKQPADREHCGAYHLGQLLAEQTLYAGRPVNGGSALLKQAVEQPCQPQWGSLGD